MRSKPEIREKARELRRSGKSLGDIAKDLHIAKGSVSTWARDIVLTQEQIDELNARRGSSQKMATKAMSEKYLSLRKEYQEQGRKLAKERNPEFISGCMLYWAEGTKSRYHLTFTNSDKDMLLFFIRFLKRFFQLVDDDIAVSCNFYINDDVTFDEVENHWKNHLGLPESCYKKTTVNRVFRTATAKRKTTTKYGVCRIMVYRVDILQMIYGALQEFVGFTNDTWISKEW